MTKQIDASSPGFAATLLSAAESAASSRHARQRPMAGRRARGAAGVGRLGRAWRGNSGARGCRAAVGQPGTEDCCGSAAGAGEGLQTWVNADYDCDLGRNASCGRESVWGWLCARPKAQINTQEWGRGPRVGDEEARGRAKALAAHRPGTCEQGVADPLPQTPSPPQRQCCNSDAGLLWPVASMQASVAVGGVVAAPAAGTALQLQRCSCLWAAVACGRLRLRTAVAS